MDTYDLASLKLPVLSGPGLLMFASAIDNPLIRPLLLGTLMESGGINRLRRIETGDVTLFLPLQPADAPGTAHPIDRVSLPDATTPGVPESVYTSSGEYAARYRKGDLTPVDVAEQFFAAADAEESATPPLSLFISIDRSDVMRQAEESADRIAAGRALSVLDGVPVAVKDELDMVPYPTTVGTRFLGSRPVTRDSTTVARLRRAGALLLGKANMHEIGINPTGHNPHYGHVRNPHSPSHDAGGSSSGCAAAVASGFAPIALGADGGGSIRVPASHCGVFGLKATFGRISTHGAAPIDPSVGHIGPIAATVPDLVLAYVVLAGPDPLDPMTLAQPAVTIDGWDRGNLDGLTIGVFRPWFDHCQPAINRRCTELLAQLEREGAAVREIEIPGLDELRIAHAVTILSEMTAAMSLHASHLKELAPATRVSLSLARAFGASDYLRAQRVRARAMETFRKLYSEVDVIVTPTSAVTSPEIPANGIPQGISDLGTVTEIMRYIIPGNMLGFPAVSFPAGTDENGLPIGMQAMGRHWEEHHLLRIARVAERHVSVGRPSRLYRLAR
jgi:Asp-tRNA(Asn)/Glu-tRNA(Gln) amidotransferase A subunit family amidase